MSRGVAESWGSPDRPVRRGNVRASRGVARRGLRCGCMAPFLRATIFRFGTSELDTLAQHADSPRHFNTELTMRRILLALLFVVPLGFTAGRTEKTYQVGRIRTPKGEILFVLYDRTPRHKASFIKLAGSHYWDSLTFNRVIKDFVAQGGCPDTPEGFSGSPYLLAPEFSDSLKHVYGAVGAGRDDNPGQLSAGCQFYIVANKQGLPKLDNHYTVYGQVFKGMDVVEAIVSVPKDSTNKPYTPITLHIDVIDMSADALKADGYVPK